MGNQNMIYIIIGTKAQFIKMAPVMVAIEKKAKRYCVINLSQHGDFGREMLNSFEISPKIITPFPRANPVDTVVSGIFWMITLLRVAVLPKDTVRKLVFEGGKGVAVVHGDTMSTLLGLILARRGNLPTALVEAGLRSGRLLSPFPEELIRRFVERWCSILFAPGKYEFLELKKRWQKKCIVNTNYNTGRDALHLIVDNVDGQEIELIPVVTVHRLETLASKKRLEKVVEIVLAISSYTKKIRFVMHPPTKKVLIKYGLLEKLESSPHIKCEKLQQYGVFAKYLVAAPFIMTDGGSIQEESSYLGKPCIILRDRTERPHGIGVTAKLTSWNAEDDWSFISSLVNQTVISCFDNDEFSASGVIADKLLEI